MAISPITPEVSLFTRLTKTLLSWVGIRDSEQKMRENAANWIELAEKVWHFRRDRLTDKEAAELRARTDDLRQRLKAHEDAARLKLSIESLEPVLRRTGGAIYPKTALVENVEFFLVAAIVILGIRTYFVQPFKIPTNSMWPTYNGMTAEIFSKREDEPSAIATAARLVAFGAFPHRLDAPGDGEILIPIGGSESRGIVHSRLVPGRTWLVIPTTLREYTILVDDKPVTVKLPLDFDFDWAICSAFFPIEGKYNQTRFAAEAQRRMKAGQYQIRIVGGERMPCLTTGRVVQKGERAFSFDEMTGDQLFVDRLSYHFFPPKVGQGFVFRTGNIHSVYMQERDTGRQIDQYYIKRLVGVPGDTLEIKGTALWRNNAPISGSRAFELNARQAENYPGYEASGLLTPEKTVHVEPGTFFAMGDNSPNSQDGRYWGFVPAADVAGRPLFIYYPFSRRWGPSR